MKNIVLMLGFLFTYSVTYAQTPITKGLWFSHEKESKIQFYVQDGLLFGKIVWLEAGDVKDTNNPNDKLRQKSLVGHVFLKGFKADGKNAWKGGKIYDPKSGKTYDAKIEMKNTNLLDIRGYIGIPKFGKSTTFSRVE